MWMSCDRVPSGEEAYPDLFCWCFQSPVRSSWADCHLMSLMCFPSRISSLGANGGSWGKGGDSPICALLETFCCVSGSPASQYPMLLVRHLPASPPEDSHLDILCLVSNNAIKPHWSAHSFPWEIDGRKKWGYHLGLKFEISFPKCGDSLLNLAIFPWVVELHDFTRLQLH